MRMRRVALLTGAAATIGGVLWWRKAKQEEADEELLLDLAASTNGVGPTEAEWERAESELSL